MFVVPEFAQWANENVVFLVGYQGKSHKVDPAPANGAETKVAKAGECALYPGLTCDEHEKILTDATEGKGGPKLEVKGFPTSYMITPDGKTFEQHKADRAVKALEDGVADFAKKAKLKPSSKYQTYLTALTTGDKAVADGKWKPAITAYMTVDAVAKKMASLGARLGPKIDALNDAVVDAFGKLKDAAATDLVAKNKSIKALRADVGAKFTTSGNLAVVADIDAWLKANPPPAPTPPAK